MNFHVQILINQPFNSNRLPHFLVLSDFLPKWLIPRSEILEISISVHVRQMNRKRWVLHRFTSYLDLIRDNFRKVLFSITFSDKSYPRGDLYGPQGWLIQIIKNILLFFVPLSSSVFRRNSFQYHIKYCDIIFMDELSKDFTSNQSQDCQFDLE